MLRILILDNHDSFTYNLVEMLRQTHHCMPEVVLLDDWESVHRPGFHGVVISPGPGLPSEKHKLKQTIEKFSGKIPMLGVCLGHQAIAQHFGAILVQLDSIQHGEPSSIQIDAAHLLFHGLPPVIDVGRYHSWAVSNENFPECLQVTSRTGDGIIMSFCHKTLAIHGVQFHPESILTPHGKQIIENWLNLCQP